MGRHQTINLLPGQVYLGPGLGLRAEGWLQKIHQGLAGILGRVLPGRAQPLPGFAHFRIKGRREQRHLTFPEPSDFRGVVEGGRVAEGRRSPGIKMLFPAVTASARDSTPPAATQRIRRAGELDVVRELPAVVRAVDADVLDARLHAEACRAAGGSRTDSRPDGGPRRRACRCPRRGRGGRSRSAHSPSPSMPHRRHLLEAVFVP